MQTIRLLLWLMALGAAVLLTGWLMSLARRQVIDAAK